MLGWVEDAVWQGGGGGDLHQLFRAHPEEQGTGHHLPLREIPTQHKTKQICSLSER